MKYCRGSFKILFYILRKIIIFNQYINTFQIELRIKFLSILNISF